MRKTIKFLFFVIASYASTLSAIAQTADFKQGCAPLSVKFTAPLGASSFYWEFKDGASSNQSSPSNTFIKPGTYNVTFQESATGPVIGTVQIIVYDDPVLNISVPVGCAPLNAQFISTSQINSAIKVNNYKWVWGDGTSSNDSIAKSNHFYSSIGKYSVSLSIETQYPSCDRTQIFNNAVEVISPPVASFSTTPSPAVTCKDTIKVSFVNQSSGVKPLTYSWNMGNGNTYTSATPPQQQYIKGQFTPTLTASYTGMTGCTASTAAGVSAGSPKPVITFQNKDTVCINTFTGFRAKATGLYYWDFGTGAIPATSNSDTVTVVFTTPGLHQISLKVTSFDGQCSGTTSSKVFVDEITAAITGGQPFICSSPAKVNYTAVTNQPNNVIYEWYYPILSFIPAGTGKDFSPTFKSESASQYYGTNTQDFSSGVALYITSKLSGCKAGTFQFDTFWLPNAFFKTNKTKGCAPMKVVFTDSSTSAPTNPIVQWKWIFGDGNSVTATNNDPVTYTYTTPGIYKARLLVTTQKGCTDTSYAITMYVGTSLTSQLNFTADKSSVCPGENVTFATQITPQTAALISAYHFSSEGNRVFHCADQQSVTWSYNDLAGAQDVRLTVDYNGCLSQVTKSGLVTVKGAIAKIDYNALCKEPLLYNFTSASLNAASVKWDFGDGQISANANESHTYAAKGNYVVILEAQSSDGCAPTKDTAVINVRQVKAVIDINNSNNNLLCAKQIYSFRAKNSIDVAPGCFTGYTWNFPSLPNKRPYTSGIDSMSFSFDTSGTQKVQLIVRDINGCKDTATTIIRLFKIKTSALHDRDVLCIPNEVKFTDQTVADTTIASWRWEFNDLSISVDSVQNPTHKYTTAPRFGGGAYNVLFRVKDVLGCVKDTNIAIGYYRLSSKVTVTKPHQFDGSANHCFGDTITLAADDFTSQGSSLSFNWDFGNGKTSSQQVNKIIYSAKPVNPIKLIFTEAASACTDSIITPVDIQFYPDANIGVDKVGPQICAPATLSFKDGSDIKGENISYYNWDFGNGQSFSGSGVNSRYDFFYDKGKYTIKYIISTSYACADTASLFYDLVRPEGNFSISKDSICKGDSILFSLKDLKDVASYQWDFGDGFIEDKTIVEDVTHQYNFHPPLGSTLAKITFRSGGTLNCPYSLADTIYIRQVIADFTRGIAGDTSLCFSQNPYPFINTSSGYDSFSWDFGNGDVSSEQNPTKDLQPGVYNVKMSVADKQFGCFDQITKKAIVYANPVLKVAPDTVCLGNTLQMKVVNPYSSFQYLWTPATGLSSDTSRAPLANIPHTTEYNVMVTDTNSCMDTTQVTGVVIEPLQLSDWDTTIVIGDKAVLPVYAPQNVYKFNWTPTQGLSCLNCYYPWVQPLADTTYKLVVSDVRNCFTTSAEYKIVVRPETFVKMPTVFTPNGDGNNDKIYVKGWGIKELVNFSVFNRWGQLLYSSSDIDAGWDGKFNGEYQNNDVYVYKIKVKTWREEEVQKEGYINLIR